jgi:hypothetical protein
MTMTTSTTLATLQAANGPQLLRLLKDLKNSVIGTIWKKVEIVEDEALLE